MKLFQLPNMIKAVGICPNVYMYANLNEVVVYYSNWNEAV